MVCEKAKATVLDVKVSSDATKIEVVDSMSYTKTRKWTITFLASFFTLLVSSSATSYSLGIPSMKHDLECTSFQATLGLSLFCFGFGVFPLITSAFSEEFGRQPLYYCSILGFMLTHLMAALARNIETVILARLLQGIAGSTGSTMVAGTVADIWAPHERGLPMAIYSVTAFIGNGVGALVAGWIEVNSNLEWRWIQWVHVIASGAYFMFYMPFSQETRKEVIWRKVAKKERLEDSTIPLPGSRSLRRMIVVSCTRPVYLLFSEPIVFSVSLWIGFAWGVYYCMVESIPGVFRTLHGFNQGQVGSVYMTMAVGGLLGFMTNIYQEKLYQKCVSHRGPQARLHLACLAGLLFPLSMFMFAWSSYPTVPWAVLVVALTIYVWAVFTIYLAVFSYLADCYGTYASSALAGQSLFRNVTATIFPLFADRMFGALGYRWANSLFAGVALVMSPIPVVLFFHGPNILARSRIAGGANQMFEVNSKVEDRRSDDITK